MMRGLIFEYYKYVRYPKESLEDIRFCLNYREAEKSILTFGEYDRLKINNIVEFGRYRDLSSMAKAWIGNRQSILLYDFSQEPEFVYVEEKMGFKEVKTNAYDQHLFWALTELPFRSELREKMDNYDELLKEAEESLHKIIEEECFQNIGDCRYIILGVLGIFGISVLWFSNQYTDVLRIVNSIKRNSKYRQERMYLAAHTMFSKNPIYDRDNHKSKLIDELQGYAFIQITLKKWITSQLESMKKDKKIQNMRHTSGEYDIAFEMKAQDVYVYFEKWDLFNHDKDEYQNNILQTRVTFTEELHQYGLGSGLTKDHDVYSSMQDLKRVNEVYENLRKLLRERLDKTSGLVDTLDSLYCDYRYNVASAVNQSWETDFSYIFLKNLECIEEMIDVIENKDIDFLAILRVILNNIKQQIFHISEANSLNFELPKCHLRYTGQEDCILFGYMGIIKEILSIAYQLKGCNRQSEIIPIVTVDVVPIIESELYLDKSECVDEKERDQEFKILSLNLPHVTFYDIPMYIPYLYHEIYHYIVPKDREQRDYIMGIFLSTILIRDILNCEFEKLFDNNVIKVRAILSYLEPLLCEVVIQNYLEVHMSITNFSNCRKNETDKVLLIGRIYKNKVIEYFFSSHSCLKSWIHIVNDKLCAGSFHGLSFDDLQLWLEKNIEATDLSALIKWFSDDGGHLFESVDKFVCVEVLDKLMDGLEEVSADIPMIELAEMPLEEYLILYAHCLKNELQNPSTIDNNDNLKELIRIGVVLDFYEQKGRQLNGSKEKFISGYMGRYINFNNENFHEIRKKIYKKRSEAEEWFAYFEECKSVYQRQFRLYRKHFRQIADMSGVSTRIQNYNIREKSDIYFRKYREIYNDFSLKLKEIENLCQMGNEKERVMSLCSEAESKLRERIFIENIKLINYFQKQKKLTELHDINQKQNQKKADSNKKYEIPTFSSIFEEEYEESRRISQIEKLPAIYELKDFLKIMNDVSRKLEQGCARLLGKKECALWYRGQKDSGYSLLPGIMRKNNLGRRDFHYLSQYQRCLYEEFKYRADGAPEVMDRSYYGISDYLCLMQHYGVNTNLMDWSEDAFTGLYFALEQLITGERHTAEADAAIFVFSPHLYNDARRFMIDAATKVTACTEPAYRASAKTAEGSDGLIPNIAANYNNKVYDMFLMGNLDYESENCYGYVREMVLDGKEEMAYLPLAVYTSRLNPRIRSQSGIFAAYNLYAEPSNAIDTYSYMDLENIQEYYFDKCERRDKEQFLYKIVIERKAAKEIAECLARMGISKERIYPELANIGQRIK